MQLMKSRGMNQQEFSRATGISPASLSSIFTGRTAPTMKHAEALHRYFPQLNMIWLMFGEGEMFLPSEGEAELPDGGDSASLVDDETLLVAAAGGDFSHQATPSDLRSSSSSFSMPSQPLAASSNPFGEPSRAIRPESIVPGTSQVANVRTREVNSYPSNLAGMSNLVNYPDIKPRKIIEIRIFFDDGTFETFQGNS